MVGAAGADALLLLELLELLELELPELLSSFCPQADSTSTIAISTAMIASSFFIFIFVFSPSFRPRGVGSFVLQYTIRAPFPASLSAHLTLDANRDNISHMKRPEVHRS